MLGVDGMQQQVRGMATRIKQLPVLARLPQAIDRLPSKDVWTAAPRLHYDRLPVGQTFLLRLRISSEMHQFHAGVPERPQLPPLIRSRHLRNVAPGADVLRVVGCPPGRLKGDLK